VGCDDKSLDDCCPTFQDSTVVSSLRVAMFIFLSLKTKHCVVSTSRHKITYCRIATSKRNEDLNRTAAGMSLGYLYLYSLILFRDILNFILFYYLYPKYKSSDPRSLGHCTLTNDRFALDSVSTPSEDVNG
jgi:hypothetical protein